MNALRCRGFSRLDLVYSALVARATIFMARIQIYDNILLDNLTSHKTPHALTRPTGSAVYTSAVLESIRFTWYRCRIYEPDVRIRRSDSLVLVYALEKIFSISILRDPANWQKRRTAKPERPERPEYKL